MHNRLREFNDKALLDFKEIRSFINRYKPYYFKETYMSDSVRKDIGIDGVKLRRTPNAIEVAGTELDDRKIGWHQFAWKSGRLKEKCKQSNQDEKEIWDDGAFCWDGKNLRGYPIKKSALEDYLDRLLKTEYDIDDLESMYKTIITLQDHDINNNELCEEAVIKNLGTVYSFMIIYFLSNQKWPIYDQFSHKAVKALYLDMSPKDVFVGQAPDKTNTNHVLAMYKEYCWLLNRVFGEISIEREYDQALWVYGHCNKEYPKRKNKF